MLDYLIVAGVAFGVVLVATPVVGWLSVKVGAVDQPGGRRVHTRPTARLGGLTLFAGFIAAIGIASQLGTIDAVFATTSDPEAVVLAATAILVVGLVDDTRGIAAPVKLAGQLLAAGTLVLFGVILRFVYVPGSVVVLATDLGVLITVAAIIAMVNSINLIDGLDGLAAGIVAIASMALFAYVQFADLLTDTPAPSSALMLAALIGMCLGFLVYNFHPASVFMGDCGAMLLGLLIGAAGVLAIGGTLSPGGSDFAAISIPVLVPALVLAVPVLDTTWTILRRIRSGRAVFSPDKKHLHHRLIEIGHSHRRAVLIMYYWSALIAFGAVGFGLLPLPVVVGVLAAGCGLAVLLAVARQVRLALDRRHATPADELVTVFTSASDADPDPASDQRKRIQRRL
jgi:UDP-GlcNAc:undecaprenyl-phosphate/decaprenyl-phosphate GlcNAc-1-phosphate transferase